MKTLKNFDLVTFLIAAAGRIQRKRHERLLEREKNLQAMITHAQKALTETRNERVNAEYRAKDIEQVS